MPVNSGIPMVLSTFHSASPFPLENGSILRGIDITFHTYGRLNADKSNVVWICHALTGSSDVAAWWPGLIGQGKFFDPDRWFIICANVPGSPYGSTSPQSLNPATQRPFLRDFPPVTIRDMVRAHSLLADHLGIGNIFLLMGGSMGGSRPWNGPSKNRGALDKWCYWPPMPSVRPGVLRLMKANGWLYWRMLPLTVSIQTAAWPA